MFGRLDPHSPEIDNEVPQRFVFRGYCFIFASVVTWIQSLDICVFIVAAWAFFVTLNRIVGGSSPCSPPIK